MSYPTLRTRTELYFLGTALPDTVSVSPGEIARSLLHRRAAREVRQVLYGQLVSVEQLGAPWAHALPPGTRQVVMVPWGSESTCGPAVWTESARWAAPGTRAVFRAELRHPEFWSASRPTLDVRVPGLEPYVRPTERPPSRQASLTEQEFLQLVEALPLEDSLEEHPEAAMAALGEWEVAHQSLRTAWPAADVLHATRWHATEARVRLLSSPFAGTFRVVLTFGTGQSSVLYLRTGPRPASSHRTPSSTGDSSVPEVSGYFLRAKVAASRGRIAPDDRGPDGSYVAAALEPFLVTRDSSLWHGELSTLVDVHFIDARPFVRAHANALLGWNERLAGGAYYRDLLGTWVLYHDGRLAYRYDLRAGATLLYSVRAERLSHETLGEYLRLSPRR